MYMDHTIQLPELKGACVCFVFVNTKRFVEGEEGRCFEQHAIEIR